MLAPTINLNGTSRDQLLDEYFDAIEAITDADKAIRAITIHGRDYDQMNPGSLHTAQAERREVLDRLDRIRTDLIKVAYQIQEG